MSPHHPAVGFLEAVTRMRQGGGNVIRRRSRRARGARLRGVPSGAVAVSMKPCPACRGVDVRRSFVRPSESNLHLLLSPYRCQTCHLRFWVISRRMRIFGALAGSAIAAIAIIAGVMWMLPAAAPDFASTPAVSMPDVDPAAAAYAAPLTASESR